MTRSLSRCYSGPQTTEHSEPHRQNLSTRRRVRPASPQTHRPVVSLLRDPLLLTLMASSLVHGLAFSLGSGTTSDPAADVRSGRTAVRLQPALAAPPTSPTAQHLLPDTPPDLTVPILPAQRAASRPSTPPPQPSPLRQAPATAPPPRPEIPQLASALVSPAPRPPLRKTPRSTPRTAPDPPLPPPAPPQQNTSRISTSSHSTRRLRPPPALTQAPFLRAPTTAAPQPRPPRTHTPVSPPLKVAVASPTHPPRAPRPTDIAPSPLPASVAQPASQSERGTVSSLPAPLPDNPIPDYPVSAARRGRQGVVVVLMKINAMGLVTSVSLNRSSGHADLDRSALAAARRWTFRPARRGKTPIAITVLKPFRFVLNRR